MRTHHTIAAVTLAASTLQAPLHADTPATSLPITEVTAFKDGHAIILRRGAAPTTNGDITLTDLPNPIMGAFWADTHEPDADLHAVTAHRVPDTHTRTAATVAELVRANVGQMITYRAAHDELRTGRLTRIIEHTPDAPPPAAPPQPVWNGWTWHTPPAAGTPGAPSPRYIALIDTGTQLDTVPIEQLRDVRFHPDSGELNTEITNPTRREQLTLDLDWTGTPSDTADVSIMAIERGIRWIPSYRITILDDTRVRIELQATLINELADLHDTTLHMAIGVPNFAFDTTPDPMGLRDQLNQLGLYFQQAHASQTGAMFSNAIMSQSRVDSRGQSGPGQPPTATTPELTDSTHAEDLYVFTLEHVTINKGSRMVLPLVEYEADAEQLYTLELAASPPATHTQNLNRDQQRELARLLDRPNARHVLRITNDNDQRYPITTAPAIVIRDGRTLAQDMLTYTAPGATVDLPVGTAVDISVTNSELETNREPDALHWNAHHYTRVDLELDTTLTNRKTHPVTIEVIKRAFGRPDTVGQDGTMETVSIFADDHFWVGPDWWRHHGWPHYWHRLNGGARFTWTVTLEPGDDTTLDATWHYFTW